MPNTDDSWPKLIILCARVYTEEQAKSRCFLPPRGVPTGAIWTTQTGVQRAQIGSGVEALAEPYRLCTELVIGEQTDGQS